VRGITFAERAKGRNELKEAHWRRHADVAERLTHEF